MAFTTKFAKGVILPTTKGVIKTFSAATGSSPAAALPNLAFDYGALEPTISGEIMEIHHSKHHNAYVTNFNAALEQYDAAEQKGDFQKMIALQGALKFNGGGHINHSIFWTNLAPKSSGGGEAPTGDLAAAIARDFGSVENLQTQLNAKSAAIQGSGWGWLGFNKESKKLGIATMANQDPLTDMVPLLGIDVWEHAYYLQYKNVRPEYLKAIWNVVNWNNVAERFKAAQ